MTAGWLLVFHLKSVFLDSSSSLSNNDWIIWHHNNNNNNIITINVGQYLNVIGEQKKFYLLAKN